MFVEDGIQDLAGQLAEMGRFASAWLFDRHPSPLEGWDLRAVPGYLAIEVGDELGRPKLIEGVEEVDFARARVLQMPAPDASGVGLGSAHGWADILPMDSRPGGINPGSTDLLAVHLAFPAVRILFVMGRPTLRGVQSWTAPGRYSRGWNTAGSSLGGTAGTPLSYPTARRARAHQQVYGSRRWDAIVVAGRGQPELRVLQVGIHEGWITPGDGLAALQRELRRLHFWRSKSDARRFEADEDIMQLVDAAARTLVDQAVRGIHVPAYPLGRSYLRLVVRKEMATVSAAWEKATDLTNDRDRVRIHRSDTGQEDQDRAQAKALLRSDVGSDRHLRRLELELVRADGIASITLLSVGDRARYRDEALRTLAERDRLRRIRSAVRERLAESGAGVSDEAVRQFVARHVSDTDSKLAEALLDYIRKRTGTSGRGRTTG